MKKYHITTMIVVFLYFCTNGMLAQSPQKNLDQVELMKQWIGRWNCGKEIIVLPDQFAIKGH